MSSRDSESRNWLLIFQRYQGLVGLVLLLVVAVFLSPKVANLPDSLFGSVFYSKGNLRNVMAQLAVPGVMALGATLVILTGGIDLSAGSLLGLLNCIAATWLNHGSGAAPTIGYVLIIGTVTGAIMGFLVGKTGLQPFVVTLAGLVSLRGLAFVYTNNTNVSGLGSTLDWVENPIAGMPISGWVLLALTIVASIVMSRTVFGRRVYALGGSPEAAHYAGVPVNRVRVGAYAANGFCIAVAAILFTARNHNGQPSAGTGYELDAITAAVVGGTSLSGGFGNVLGTFVGALFIVCLNILIILKGVNYQVGQGWKGIIILVAVYLQNLGRRKA